MALESLFSSYLVTPTELHEALQRQESSGSSQSPLIIPLAAPSFPPGDERKGVDAFHERHITGARFFDLNEASDKQNRLPHMLPPPSQFASYIGSLGIGKDDIVVMYDTYQLGITSAPRAAWTFKVFGHKHVHILNNFKLWIEEQYPVEAGEISNVEAAEYPVPELEVSRVIDFNKIKEIAISNTKIERTKGVQILDARSHGRWSGADAEPRPSLASGHMPGSINIPVGELLDMKTKAFLPAEKLKELFVRKRVDPGRPIITSCGSGVTAAVIDAALAVAEFGCENDRRLYDGSWFEWASRVQASDGLISKSTT